MPRGEDEEWVVMDSFLWSVLFRGEKQGGEGGACEGTERRAFRRWKQGAESNKRLAAQRAIWIVAFVSR